MIPWNGRFEDAHHNLDYLSTFDPIRFMVATLIERIYMFLDESTITFVQLGLLATALEAVCTNRCHCCQRSSPPGLAWGGQPPAAHEYQSTRPFTGLCFMTRVARLQRPITSVIRKNSESRSLHVDFLP